MDWSWKIDDNVQSRWQKTADNLVATPRACHSALQIDSHILSACDSHQSHFALQQCLSSAGLTTMTVLWDQGSFPWVFHIPSLRRVSSKLLIVRHWPPRRLLFVHMEVPWGLQIRILKTNTCSASLSHIGWDPQSPEDTCREQRTPKKISIHVSKTRRRDFWTLAKKIRDNIHKIWPCAGSAILAFFRKKKTYNLQLSNQKSGIICLNFLSNF